MIEKPSIVLVTGVPGVGKTTLCRDLADAQLGICHLEASSFIYAEFAGDQIELAHCIVAAAMHRKEPSLVDGHLVLAGARVPLEAVARLSPIGIVVVTGRPQDIARQRASDFSKTRPSATEDEIGRAQEAKCSGPANWLTGSWCRSAQ